MTKNDKQKELFESWFIAQFKAESKILLKPYDDKNGYCDDSVNSLWVGFRAGYKLHDSGL